jgi:protein O-mannosyl-transferase
MSERRPVRSGLHLVAALAVAAAVYANAFQCPFTWDDGPLITSSPLVRQLDPLPHLARTFWSESPDRQADMYYYRPLTSWSYALDWARGGGSTAAFHATNVLLHLWVVALAFLLGRQAGGSPVASALGAALFGAFPRLTESVTWISGRTDVLAAALALAALVLHVRAGGRWPWRSLAALCLFLGLLSKEVAAGAAVGIAVYELAGARRGEKPWRAALGALVPELAALAAYAAIRLHAQLGVAAPPASWPQHPLLMPFQALGSYLLMLADPRPRLQIGLLGAVELLPLALGLLAAATIGVLLLRAARRPPRPLTAALLATAGAALALVLHIFPLRLAIVAADRFLYLPVACLAPLAAVGADAWHRRAPRAAVGVAVGLLAVYAALTVRRNEDWADEVRLWQEAVATAAPGNPIPIHELGSALNRLGRPEEALAAFRQALPGLRGARRALVLANVASTLSDLGRLEEAAAAQGEVVALEPERPVNHFNLAVMEMRRLRFDAARTALDTALRLMPDYADARRASAMVDSLRTTAASLPAETPGEPLELRLRRARFWTSLTLPSRALPLWAAVLDDPRSPPTAVQEAASYLVVNAPAEVAAHAVRRARDAGVAPGILAALEAVRADRFGDAAGGGRP